MYLTKLKRKFHVNINYRSDKICKFYLKKKFVFADHIVPRGSDTYQVKYLNNF